MSISLNLIADTKALGKIWLRNAIILEIGKFGVITECLIFLWGKHMAKFTMSWYCKGKIRIRWFRSYISAYDTQNGDDTDLLIMYYYYSVAPDDTADSQEDTAILWAPSYRVRKIGFWFLLGTS